MNEDLIFSPVSMPITTPELVRELLSEQVDEVLDKKINIIDATAITIVSSDTNLQVGQTIKLSLDTTPTNANAPIVIWESSDPSIATINSDGIVLARSEGEVRITATSAQDPNITNTITITISATGEDTGGGEDEEETEGAIVAEDGQTEITTENSQSVIVTEDTNI